MEQAGAVISETELPAPAPAPGPAPVPAGQGPLFFSRPRRSRWASKGLSPCLVPFDDVGGEQDVNPETGGQIWVKGRVLYRLARQGRQGVLYLSPKDRRVRFVSSSTPDPAVSVPAGSCTDRPRGEGKGERGQRLTYLG